MKLDTLYLVETPEGTDLQADVVGVVPRTLAYSIDLTVRLGALIFFQAVMALTGLGLAGDGLTLVFYFLLEWWYPVVFEVYRGGQTIGKKAFRIKVVNEDLTPVRLSASLTRNLLRVADFLPVGYVIGIISMMMNRRFQRLGDLAANTIVIYTEDQSVLDEQSSEMKALENVKAIAPSMPLTEAQQAAVINFALNIGGLSLARQKEVADIIEPRLPSNVSDTSEYIRGVGKWLLGSK